jgi:nucleotide-binding universal stress UspA family protein
MNAPLRQVLVHLDSTASSAARLRLARHLAGEHGASVSALYAAVPSLVEVPYAGEVGGGVAASLAAFDEELRQAARARFDEVMREPGAQASWSATGEVPLAGAVAQQALYADLLVLGQHDASDPARSRLPADFVPSVIAASGKPAIVVPFVGWTRPVGRTVVIAWKETPQAARAVAAALPLLQRAAAVHVVSWAAGRPPPLQGPRLDLEGYLRLHGVDTRWNHYSEDEPAALGELLLSRAFDLDADLLVMGCYGHSRVREWVLGGVSRTVLGAMTLPVLMAH